MKLKTLTIILAIVFPFFPFLLRYIRLHPFCQFAAREHDTMLTAFAFQPNIRAQAHHDPFVRTAGMWFAQAQVIFHLQVRQHGWDYTALFLSARDGAKPRHEHGLGKYFSPAMRRLSLKKLCLRT